jgi:hypothetical protein
MSSTGKLDMISGAEDSADEASLYGRGRHTDHDGKLPKEVGCVEMYDTVTTKYVSRTILGSMLLTLF